MNQNRKEIETSNDRQLLTRGLVLSPTFNQTLTPQITGSTVITRQTHFRPIFIFRQTMNDGSKPPQHPPILENNEQLKVEDALRYLDRVKATFNNNNDSYNRFLSIMKEFKSQDIDTQRVIHRVAQLFEGHDELIEDFNTFLPPKFDIKVRKTAIYISEPVGFYRLLLPRFEKETLSQNDYNEYLKLENEMRGTQAVKNKIEQNQMNLLVKNASVLLEKQAKDDYFKPTPQPKKRGPKPKTAVNLGFQHQFQNKNLPKPITTTNSPFINTSMAPSIDLGAQFALNLKNTFQKQQNQQQKQPEMDHAINYVNKIKARFQSEPAVYKKFLEILHKYQKEESKSHLTETNVYKQIAELFNNNEDLLLDFAQFLPESTGMASIHKQHMEEKHRKIQEKKDDKKLILQNNHAETNTVVFQPIEPKRTEIKNTSGVTSGIVSTPSTIDTGEKKAKPKIAAKKPESYDIIRMRNEIPATITIPAINVSSTENSPRNQKREMVDNVTGGTPAKVMKPVAKDEVENASPADSLLFDDIKQKIPEPDYENFIRTLNKYNQDVFTYREMLTFARNILPQMCFKKFESFLSQHDPAGPKEEPELKVEIKEEAFSPTDRL